MTPNDSEIRATYFTDRPLGAVTFWFMPESARSYGRAAGLVVVVALVLGVAMLGAVGGGSWQLETRWDLYPSRDPLPTTTTSMPDGGSIGASGEEGLWDLSFVGNIFVFLVVAGVGWAMWKLWKLFRARMRRQRFSGDVGPLHIAKPEPELPVLRRGVEAARQYLADIGDSDDAIIAAWLALEEAAASTGVRRKASQTPTEFTIAVLESTQADSEAANGLLALYERARFSNHPTGRADVEAASIYLRRLAKSWERSRPVSATGEARS